MTPEPPDDLREFGPPEPQETESGSAPEGFPPRSGPLRRDLNMPRRYSRWALWGCATLGLVGLLFAGGFLLVYMQQPGFGAWVRFAENVTVCREQMGEVSGALQRYHADKGRLPARLEDVYPTYLADDKHLQCPADATATGGAKRKGVSYVYRRSVGWGKGREVLVFCPHHPAPRRLPGVPDGQQIHQIPLIRQDGAVDAITGRLADLGDTQPASPKAPAAPAAPPAR